MAQKVTTTVEITDDIDGSPNAKTVKFGLDDKQYTIDLGEAHEASLREFLALFVGHAKPATKTTRKSPRSTSRSIDIRDWARAQGMPVSERGRIAQDIIDAYDAAQARGVVAATPPAPADPVTVAQVAFEPAPAALS